MNEEPNVPTSIGVSSASESGASRNEENGPNEKTNPEEETSEDGSTDSDQLDVVEIEKHDSNPALPRTGLVVGGVKHPNGFEDPEWEDATHALVGGSHRD